MTGFICGPATDDDIRIVEELRRQLAGEAPSNDIVDVDDFGVPSHDVRRRRQIEQLTDQIGIPAGVLIYIDEHNSGDANSYHNTQHCYTVALNAHQGALIERLPRYEHHLLILAALFHDIDHTGTASPDKTNVDLALHAFTLACDGPLDYLSTKAATRVRDLIRATQTPLTPAADLAGGIIQDADALQTTEPDGDRWEQALRDELYGFPTREQSIHFLTSRKWNTGWGRKRANDYLTSIKENHPA